MCSPQVMAQVQEAVSRRQFLGRVGAAGAAAALGAVALTPGRAARQGEATPGAGGFATPAGGPVASPAALGGFTRIQDLSHTASPTFPMFPGAQQMQINSPRVSAVAWAGISLI